MELRGIGLPYNASHQFIDENIVRGLGDKVAIYYEDETITYRQLRDLVNQAGNMLKGIGVRMEDRILINCYDTPEFVYSFFGAIRMGAVPIPVNTSMPASDYEYYLNNSRARVLIVHEDLWENIRHLRERFLYLEQILVISESAINGPSPVRDFYGLMNGASTDLDPPWTNRDDAAFWLFSSGSTGNPKGVTHLQHDMEFALNSYAKNILKLTEEDRCLSASKLYFAYGLGGGMYFSLGTGGSTVLVKERPLPETMFEAIEKYKPTVFFGVPTLYGAMIDFAERSGRSFDLSSLRVCVSAGEALPPSYLRKWKSLYNVDILDGIGSTEALHIFLSNRLGDIKEGSSGKIVPGFEAKIVNEQGVPLAPNEIGDLVIQGDSIAHGYWNLHEQNKAKFVGRWLYTGDKYYKDEEGYYWYCGRADDMLKVGGIWVSPVEIENCLLQHEGVLEAAVIGEVNENNLVLPKAYIVLKENIQPSAELENELKEYVKGQLARYKYPRIIQFIDELPKTTTGKIQRFKLRELLRSSTLRI